MTDKNPKNWAERLKNAFERHPVIIVISILVIAISQLTTIIDGVTNFNSYRTSRFEWRGQEEAIINQLSAAISISKFQEMLGAPLFFRQGHLFDEYVFKRQGYWAQAITDKQGAVALYAITSCDASFKPVLKNLPTGTPIQLRVTTFEQVANGTQPQLHYFISGASANSYVIEELYLANPGNYQTILWGYNDACANNWHAETGLTSLGKFIMRNGTEVDLEQPVVREFRANNPINTFAVTAPFIKAAQILNEFQIGIDRIQVRVYRPVEQGPFP